MKNKKENELLKEIVPILIKYDLVTIENCMEYITENKQQLSNLITFANGEKFEVQKNRDQGAIDEVLLTTEKEKSAIIKRIYKSLSCKRFSFEQIYNMSIQFFEEREVPINLHVNNKDALLLEVVRGLACLHIDEIKDFEYDMQINKRTEGENTLENWSKVIVKPTNKKSSKN